MLGLLAAIAGILTALAADVLASRQGFVRVRAYFTSLLTGVVVALLSALLLGHGHLLIATIAIALLSYVIWWFVLLNLIQALASSLRVRLLQEVRTAGGRISRQALNKRYSDESLLSLRLERLLSHGAIVEVDRRLHVASSGLRILARMFRILKKILTGRTSEFGAPSA